MCMNPIDPESGPQAQPWLGYSSPDDHTQTQYLKLPEQMLGGRLELLHCGLFERHALVAASEELLKPHKAGCATTGPSWPGHPKPGNCRRKRWWDIGIQADPVL